MRKRCALQVSHVGPESKYFPLRAQNRFWFQVVNLPFDCVMVYVGQGAMRDGTQGVCKNQSADECMSRMCMQDCMESEQNRRL